MRSLASGTLWRCARAANSHLEAEKLLEGRDGCVRGCPEASLDEASQRDGMRRFEERRDLQWLDERYRERPVERPLARDDSREALESSVHDAQRLSARACSRSVRARRKSAVRKSARRDHDGHAAEVEKALAEE